MQDPAQPILFQPPDFVFHAGTHRPGEDDKIDWDGTINRAGTLANRPAASTFNKGCYYFASDVNGGTLYRSDGATWTQVAAGVTTDTTATNAIPKSTGTTKGDIITFTGSSTPVRRGVPSNNNILYADSAQTDGWNVGLIAQAMLTAGYRLPYAGTSAPASPSAGDHWYDTTNKLLNVYNGSVWITITPVSATVLTNETTASTTYTNLATTGPAVTINTGTKAIIAVSAQMVTAANQTAAMAPAVSGATTIAAADAMACGVGSVAADLNVFTSRTFTLTTLTAGSNTFTAKYVISGGAAVAFLRREIVVTAVPT